MSRRCSTCATAAGTTTSRASRELAGDLVADEGHGRLGQHPDAVADRGHGDGGQGHGAQGQVAL